MRLESFVQGRWQAGEAAAERLVDATTGELVAEIASGGVNYGAALKFARARGGPALRALTFHQRAALLKSLAKHLGACKEELYALSYATGATRADSVLDIEGGLGTLHSYASRGVKELPDTPFYVEGKAEVLSKSGGFIGQHLCVPLEGAAVHINAYNFPVWGMLEKLAPTLLAGVPAIVKPASPTAYLSELVMRRMFESELLPEGAVQFICGNTGDLFEHLRCLDAVSLTGSARTARLLRAHPTVLEHSVRFTAETDSINASVLGPDARPGTEEFTLFVREVVREMKYKAGQRCTAIRRAIVPAEQVEAAAEALRAAFREIVVGDPRLEQVDMGPLVGQTQRHEVLARITELRREAEPLTGDPRTVDPEGADRDTGAFIAPTLLFCRDPRRSTVVHSVEAFGPVCTLMPYESLDDAIAMARRGEGSLVASAFTADEDISLKLVLGLTPWHGRVLLVNRHCAEEQTGHGSPMPGLIHGGPGRAGGGEELGGIRAVLRYMQRSAVQGTPQTLAAFRGGAD